MAKRLRFKALFWDSPEGREVDGYETVAPGLGVFRREDCRWPVVHLASGLYLCSLERRNDALLVADLCGKYADWTLSDSDLIIDDTLYTKVNRVYRGVLFGVPREELE